MKPTSQTDIPELILEYHTSRMVFAEEEEEEEEARLVVSLKDVTERKRAEGTLRRSESQFRLIWENSVDGMRLTDSRGTVLLVNEAFCRLVGKPRTEIEGKPMCDIYAEADREQILARHREHFTSHAAPANFEHHLKLWDGREIWLEVANCFFEPEPSKLVLLGLFRDITERKQLEAQFRQAQKMEAIGQLAAGVAHDFNNMLAVIRGNADMALMFPDQPGESASECINQIIAASERAASLTRQLLAFGRKQVMQSQPLDLNEVIGNLGKMLKRIIGENMGLQFNYARPLPFALADAGMMEQVLLNLVVNARDAMPHGGQLRISTVSTTFDEAYAQAHPEARAGEFVCLSVSDTGTGIAPEDLPRIFEPFYTTKEVGKGTGLGLASVYGIVKQHEGWIEVATQPGLPREITPPIVLCPSPPSKPPSSPGELTERGVEGGEGQTTTRAAAPSISRGGGTTFKIFLPAIPASATEAAAPPAAPALRGGPETILLVEDDPAVRLLTRRMLEAFDYRVIEAASGRAAMEIWRSRAAEIDLLLTDIVMPDGVSGRELAEALSVERPALKAIFMSGYSRDMASKGTEFIRRTKLLQKPFSCSVLIQTVRKCLDEK